MVFKALISFITTLKRIGYAEHIFFLSLSLSSSALNKVLFGLETKQNTFASNAAEFKGK